MVFDGSTVGFTPSSSKTPTAIGDFQRVTWNAAKVRKKRD